MAKAGIADPDCYSWSEPDRVYNPTADREGRTVHIPQFVPIGDIDEQKRWLLTVGPLTASFDAYTDFGGNFTGVYRKTNTAKLIGGHVVIIVGFDDLLQAWIIKNSWGPSFGSGGFAYFGYGECNIDYFTKYGIRGTNPDPWTKRRCHNGCLIESGNGPSHKNFEMLWPSAGRVIHGWRTSGEGGDFSWHEAGRLSLPNDVGAGAGSLGYPALTSTTWNRNFECVYWESSGRLRHWWMDQRSKQWGGGALFGPSDVAGWPGFIQSNYGAPGHLEVVFRTRDGRLNLWWRDSNPPWTWHDGGRFASNVLASGPSFIQSSFGTQKNFEVVCVLTYGRMQHWFRDNDNGGKWIATVAFGANIPETPVCMIEGQINASDETKIGNFELCVAANGHVEHWYRENQKGGAWGKSAEFGHDVRHVWGLTQSSFGFDLEVIVERFDGGPQHYWRDGRGWHEGSVISIQTLRLDDHEPTSGLEE
jgi:hypothetical protein